MERFDLEVDDLIVVDHETRSSRSSSSAKKRKWREIEALKEKYRLEKELASIDMAFDGLSGQEF